MQFTKFGRTGLTVSRMCLGTGTFGKQTNEEEAHRMLDKAVDAGGRDSTFWASSVHTSDKKKPPLAGFSVLRAKRSRNDYWCQEETRVTRYLFE